MALPPGRRDSPIDWWKIDNSLFHAQGLLPRDIDRMTLAEIACCLEEPGQARAGANMPQEEIDAVVRGWIVLTPRQRLERLRDGGG